MSKELIEPRMPATRIKHQILEDYIPAWGGIILNGLSGYARAIGKSIKDVTLIYVDTCSGVGRYAGDDGVSPDTVFGSPIIGINAMDGLATYAKSQGVPLATKTLLLETDPQRFDELKESLRMCGFDGRTVNTHDVSKLASGQIGCINEDWLAVSDQIVKQIESEAAYAMWFIDPWGPIAIPMSAVANAVTSKRADAIVYAPTLRMVITTGLVWKKHTNGGISEKDEKLISHFDGMFGGCEWHNLVTEMGGARSQEDAVVLETTLTQHYADNLAKHDDNLIVKLMPLQMPDKARTLYTLCLTTRDASGALAMNHILHKADADQFIERKLWQVRAQLRADEEQGQSSLFAAEEFTPKPATAPRRGIDWIAKHIALINTGKTMRLRDVRKSVARTDFFPEEVVKAVKELKKLKRASWEGDRLTASTAIRFE